MIQFIPKQITIPQMNYSLINRMMLIVMLVAELIIFANLTPYFLQLDNLFPVSREISTLGLVAIGQTMCLLSGGFDLSVGGTAAISCVVVGAFCSPKKLALPYYIGLPAGLIVALGIGMANGFLVTKVKINPLITTLAMNFILGGAVILITKQPITVNTAAFKFLGATTLGDIRLPLPILVFVALYILYGFLLKYSVFGRQLYSSGGNAQAARIAGINVEKIKFWTYTQSALIAGFAGIMLASRIATSNPNIGSTYALESIAATVLGGTALSGGEGNVWGAFLGVFVTGLLSNGLIMVGAPQAWRDIATGLVLIAAICLQLASKNSKRLTAA